MERKLMTMVAASAALAAASAFSTMAQQTSVGAEKVILPQDLKWGAAPASLPAGAQAALLYGDPSKEGLFALRVKIPKDYFIPPHTHPQAEIVTILTGGFSLGMGPKADRRAAKPIGAGGFMAMPPQMAHYVFADEETVLQITSIGPWGIDYVNPRDDPRLNVAPTLNRGSAQRGD